MTIIQLSSSAQYDNLIGSNTYSIVSYTTTWCPYCIAIMPTFESLSNSYYDVQFLNADLNKLGVLTTRESIKGMPTFIIFKNGQRVERIESTNRDGLVRALNSVSRYKL
jgi:thioredoxin 1